LAQIDTQIFQSVAEDNDGEHRSVLQLKPVPGDGGKNGGQGKKKKRNGELACGSKKTPPDQDMEKFKFTTNRPSVNPGSQKKNGGGRR